MNKVPITKDKVSIPWLNEVLSSKHIKVVSFAWDGSANNGVLNALSSLERIILTVTREGSEDSLVTFPIVVKSVPEDPGVRSYAIKENYCMRELKAYTEIFPAWKEFLDERNVPQEYRCRLPECYYGADEGIGTEWRSILLIEDLVAAGLKIWPGGFASSFSWKQAKPIVKQIALLHAVGIAYRITQGTHYSSKYPYLLMKCDELIDYYIQSGFDSTIKMLQDEKEKQTKAGKPTDEEFLIEDGLFEVLNSFRGTLQERIFRMMQYGGETTDTKMETLCHMDLHVNNVMFSNDLEEAVLLDFQVSQII